MKTEPPLTDYHIMNENGDLFGNNDAEINVPSDTFFPFIEVGCLVEDHQARFQDRCQSNSQCRNTEYFNVLLPLMERIKNMGASQV